MNAYSFHPISLVCSIKLRSLGIVDKVWSRSVVYIEEHKTKGISHGLQLIESSHFLDYMKTNNGKNNRTISGFSAVSSDGIDFKMVIKMELTRQPFQNYKYNTTLHFLANEYKTASNLEPVQFHPKRKS